jgi:kumamolisin
VAVAAIAATLAPAVVYGGLTTARAADEPGYTPAQLGRAYDFASLWQHGWRGKGQTIAFMEVDGVDPADLDHFDAVYHLPAAQLDVLVPQGSDVELAPGPETTMDVEYAHALAPEARLQVYEVIKAGDFVNYKQHLADAVSAAIQGGATIISVSLRGTGSILCSTFWASLSLHRVFQDAAAKGVTTFAASGDDGYRKCQGHGRGTVYPAADPYVTGVGGTTLILKPSGAYGGGKQQKNLILKKNIKKKKIQ